MASPRMAGFPSFLEPSTASLNSHGGAPDLSLSDAAFMPFTLDVAPLQRFLIHLAQQVEVAQKEREALRTEVSELKIERRLEALEQGLQDLADIVQRQAAAPPPVQHHSTHHTPTPNSAMHGGGRDQDMNMQREPSNSGNGGGGGGTSGGGGHHNHGASRDGNNFMGGGGGGGGSGMGGIGAVSSHGNGNGSGGGGGNMGGGMGGIGAISSHSVGSMSMGHNPALASEFAAAASQMKDRMTQLERKSEALWHVQENEEQLRASIERLKLEAASAREAAVEAQALAKAAQHAADRLDGLQRHSKDDQDRLEEKVTRLEATAIKATEDRADIVNNWESTTGQIWDQMRHVEASLSTRLATSETGQVSALQEVDEMKELSTELMQRVDEAKRHMGALEGKLESFNTQVAAAISPLHSSISAVNTRMSELAGSKLDVALAVTTEDVALATARAVDHADRRSDGILKSIAGVEQRMEKLTGSKADRGDVVMLSDMQRILDAHGAGLDGKMAALRAGIMTAVEVKADRDDLGVVDARLSGRLGGLEQAILKGLKAISDKVSMALSEKLALAAFNEFKVQVRAVLADLEDRLREWSPTALATKAAATADGQGGMTTCLFCDNRVKSVKDLRALGFANDDKVFSPEKLPTVDSWHPAMASATGVGAHTNAKAAAAAARKRDAAPFGQTVFESLPAVPGAYDSTLTGGLTTLDAMQGVQLPDGSPRGGMFTQSGRVKVDIETINAGAVGHGRMPASRSSKQQSPAPKATTAPKAPKLPNLPTLDGISGWPADNLEASTLAISHNNIHAA